MTHADKIRTFVDRANSYASNEYGALIRIFEWKDETTAIVELIDDGECKGKTDLRYVTEDSYNCHYLVNERALIKVPADLFRLLYA